MSRLIYEHSVSHWGHLIIPFVRGVIGGETVYSYQLLSERGHWGQFHKAENPSGVCDRTLESMIAIAQDFLEQNSDCTSDSDYFKYRYTYRHNLIIALQEAGKWFYDHYPPEELRNIAAPKIFKTEHECLTWVKQGLDRNHPTSSSINIPDF